MLDLLAFAALMAATRATIDPDLRQSSRAVHYADLDLRTRQGQSTLDRRVRSAARRVCQSLAFGSVMNARLYHGCRSRAISGAQDQVIAAITRQGGQPDAADAILVARK